MNQILHLHIVKVIIRVEGNTELTHLQRLRLVAQISSRVESRLDHQAALNKFESQLEKFPLDIFQPLSCAITFDKIANLPPSSD